MQKGQLSGQHYLYRFPPISRQRKLIAQINQIFNLLVSGGDRRCREYKHYI